MNYIDLLIILVLVYFASEALRHGFWVLLADFFAFFGSLLISLRAYKFLAAFFGTNFSIPNSVANAVGFLVTAIVSEAVLGFILGHLLKFVPKKVRKHRLNKVLGIIPALGEGLILVAFLLTLTMGLPIRPSVKNDITESRLGSLILERTQRAEKAINEVFGGVIDDSLTYLTVKPGTKEAVPLKVEKVGLSVDEAAEGAMFALVNKERRERGIRELTWSPEIVVVARAHARDMWERKYFGHVSPEGKDVGDRLDDAGVSYFLAGENLALAPTVSTAMNGLMSSEGHRANILETKFGRVGIGVIDNGVYGKMFVQVFAN